MLRANSRQRRWRPPLGTASPVGAGSAARGKLGGECPGEGRGFWGPGAARGRGVRERGLPREVSERTGPAPGGGAAPPRRVGAEPGVPVRAGGGWQGGRGPGSAVVGPRWHQLLILRGASVQRGGGGGRQRDVHPARLYLLRAGRLPGEAGRGQRGEHRRGCASPSPAPVTELGSGRVWMVPAVSLVPQGPVGRALSQPSCLLPCSCPSCRW